MAEGKGGFFSSARNWILTLVLAGVTAAVVPAIASLLSSSGHTITNKVGLTSDPPPLSFTVSATPTGACTGWVFAKPIGDIPFRDLGSNNNADNSAWALGAGGVDETAGEYTLTVQGSSDEAVIIRDLRVKVVSRAPAIVGTAIMRAADCGGTVSSRNYSVDLTASNPQLLLEDVHGEPTTDHQLYTVSKSDPEVFLLIGHLTDSGSVTYEYQLDWSQGSHSGTSDIVAPNGKPFAVTTGGTNPVYLPRDGQWAGLTKP